MNSRLQPEEAWAALHRPETSSAELDRIAADYPGFAAALAAHPNASPPLRDWANGVVAAATAAAPAEPGAALQAAPQFRRRFTPLWIIAFVVVLVSQLIYTLLEWWLLSAQLGSGSGFGSLWRLWGWVDPLVPAAFVAVVAVIAAPKGWRRIVAPCVIFLPALVMTLTYQFAPDFYFSVSIPFGDGFFPVLYFLHLFGLPIGYGLARPITGLGWVALTVPVLAVSAMQWTLTPLNLPFWLFTTLHLLCTVLSVVFAEMLTRSARRRTGAVPHDAVPR